MLYEIHTDLSGSDDLQQQVKHPILSYLNHESNTGPKNINKVSYVFRCINKAHWIIQLHGAFLKYLKTQVNILEP